MESPHLTAYDLTESNLLLPICCMEITCTAWRLPAQEITCTEISCTEGDYLHGRLPARKLAALKGHLLHRKLPAQRLPAGGNYLHKN